MFITLIARNNILSPSLGLKITLQTGRMEKMVSKMVLGKQPTENTYKEKHA